MDITYRLRLLIYFAAFMLVMSLCFVYAEPLPHPGSPLLFATSPQHGCFLAPLAAEPTFDPAALHATELPTISPVLLEQLQQSAHPHHNPFRRSHRALPRLAPSLPATESSGLNGSSFAPAEAADAPRSR